MFEIDRKFADMRSQVFRIPLWRPDYKQSWCDPSVAPAEWLGDFVPSGEASAIRVGDTIDTRAIRGIVTSVRRRMSDKVDLIAGELLLANFRSSHSAGVPAVALFLLEFAGILVLFTVRGTPLATERPSLDLTGAITGVAIASIALALLLNEAVAATYLSPDGMLQLSTVHAIRWLQVAVVGVGVALALGRRAVAGTILVIQQSVSKRATKTWLFAVALVVPWLVLLLVADAERRFLWLWPLQAIVLAAAVIHVPKRLGLSWLAPMGSLALVLIVAANTVTLSRLQSWWHDGWAGTESLEIQVVDHLAGRLKAHGESRASIGYEIDILSFEAVTNSTDPRYKVGADLDLLLKYRHGIVNLNRCAEGVATADTYRVVQVEEREGTDRLGKSRIVVRRDPAFRLTDQIGSYQLLERH
jgi:hypothetical protein